LQLARQLRGTHEVGRASYRCEHGQGGVAEVILGEEKNSFHLADLDGSVVEAFGVSRFLGFALRHAFLIMDGNVIWRDKKASTSDAGG